MSPPANQTPLPTAPPPAPDGFDEFEELPPRPRRKLATPLHLALLAVLVTALGFIAGVLVEKGQTPTTTAAAGGGARRSAGGAGGAGATGAAGGTRAGAAAAGATVGTISSINGRTLYVTDTQGTTIRISPASSATVIRTATSAVAAIHPGDTVIVQGTKAADGSMTATTIRATAPNAAGAGGLGGLGGRGGSASPTGAAPAGAPAAGSAATPSTTTKATTTPQLFGSG